MSNDQTAPRPPGVHRLRRSLHFVPGADERMLAKSLATRADGLVLDLEDAVTPERKDAARHTVADWLGSVDFSGKERVVRVNPLETPWGHDDLRIVMRDPPDALLIPKVSRLADLQQIDELLGLHERDHGHPAGAVGLIVVSTETPLGALNVASFPSCRRVLGLTWGAEDLSAVLGVARNRFPDGRLLDTYRWCRVQTLLAAAAGGVQPLDTAYVDIRNPDGLRAECQEAAWMGFLGKITIHPGQIDIVNEAFTPSADEVAEAERLVEAMTAAEQAGRMAIAFEGRMIDVPHLERAKRLLERARRIAEST
ncbi:MAG: HpcH/HpaI aldolase/citrate lyase family protein [Quisquiliibacterium sp.]